MAGWEAFQGSCYYFDTGAKDLKVWEDARGTCEAAGASMVDLQTPEEDAFFRDHVPETDNIWLGLFSKFREILYRILMCKTIFFEINKNLFETWSRSGLVG